MLRAVRAVVGGLLLWTAYDMAYTVFGVKKFGFIGATSLGWDKIFFVLVAFGLLTLTEINPAFVIFGAAVLGGVVYR